MVIKDIDLFEFDRNEFLHFLNALLDFYYIQFNQILEIKEKL